MFAIIIVIMKVMQQIDDGCKMIIWICSLLIQCLPHLKVFLLFEQEESTSIAGTSSTCDRHPVSKHHYLIEIAGKPRSSSRFSNNHIIKSKKKQVELILMIYFI